MSVQIALFAPATRVASRKLGPTAGRRSLARRPPSTRGGLRDEQVREHVRQVRDARHQPVVGVGVDRRGLRAEAREQAVQALVEHAGGAAARGRQVPDGAVEQVGARVLDARGLGAGEGMPADEALVGATGLGDDALGRADVADDAVRAGARASAARTSSHERADGRGDEHDVGVRRPPPAMSAAASSIAPSSSAARAHARVGVIAAHLAPARSRAARPIEPPISPTPRTATFTPRLSAFSRR